MRVLFAFDLRSRAIMLVAGDKAGNWSKWYSTNIPIADDLLTEHQDKLREELRDATMTPIRNSSRTRKKGQKR